MNAKVKALLGESSGNYTPRTLEELEEGRRVRHRADLRADRALQRWENSQAVQIPYVLRGYF